MLGQMMGSFYTVHVNDQPFFEQVATSIFNIYNDTLTLYVSVNDT